MIGVFVLLCEVVVFEEEVVGPVASDEFMDSNDAMGELDSKTKTHATEHEYETSTELWIHSLREKYLINHQIRQPVCEDYEHNAGSQVQGDEPRLPMIEAAPILANPFDELFISHRLSPANPERFVSFLLICGWLSILLVWPVIV